MPGSRWWIAAPSSTLREKPLAAKVQGTPLALFRDQQGRPHAFFDRCPHRGYPLSPGTCKQGRLVCGYHGWEFDGAGVCRHQPAAAAPLPDEPLVTTYAAMEQDGYVWVRIDGESTAAPKLYLAKGAWQPWTHVIDEPVDAVAARLRPQPGWQAQDEPGAGEVAVHWELAAASTQKVPRVIVHLVPENDERTRVEILEGPSHWYDLGPLRFRRAKTGLPDRAGFLRLAKSVQPRPV